MITLDGSIDLAFLIGIIVLILIFAISVRKAILDLFTVEGCSFLWIAISIILISPIIGLSSEFWDIVVAHGYYHVK